MPKRHCLHPACRDWATYRGRCPIHAKEHDRSIDRKGKATYNTKRWQILRRHKLGLNPICELCDKNLATEVHHIVPIAEGGEEFSLPNLQSLCKPCHSGQTRLEQMGK